MNSKEDAGNVAASTAAAGVDIPLSRPLFEVNPHAAWYSGKPILDEQKECWGGRITCAGFGASLYIWNEKDLIEFLSEPQRRECDITLSSFEREFVLTHEHVIRRNLTIRGDNEASAWGGNRLYPVWEREFDNRLRKTAPTVVRVARPGRALHVLAGVTVRMCGLAFVGPVADSEGDTRGARDALYNASVCGTTGHGGALRVSGGSVTLSECSMTGFCTAPGFNGGAIHIEGGGQLKVAYSNFTANGVAAVTSANGASGGRGGGIHITNGTASLRASRLDGNVALRGVGGAIYSTSNGSVTLIDSDLVGNEAVAGGAIYVHVDANRLGSTVQQQMALSIEGSSLTGNSAQVGGRALTIAPSPTHHGRSMDGGSSSPGTADALWAPLPTAFNSSEFAYEASAVAIIVSSSFDSLPSSTGGDESDEASASSSSAAAAISTSFPIDWRCPLGFWTTIPRYHAYYGGHLSCPFPCGAGYYADTSNRRGCSRCIPGHYCPVAITLVPVPCPVGTHMPNTSGAASNTSCLMCADGTFGTSEANINHTCTACPSELVSTLNRTMCVEPLPGTVLAAAVPAMGVVALLLGVCAILIMRRKLQAWSLKARFASLRTPLTPSESAASGADRAAAGRHENEITLSRLETEQRETRELLCVLCSPDEKEGGGGQKLEGGASSEIIKVAEACQWGSALKHLWQCRANELVGELGSRPTRRLLISGHYARAAPVSTGERAVDVQRSLGFSVSVEDANGSASNLQPFQPEGLADILAPFFPSSGGGGLLRLIFLSGCKSEALGERLRERGAECVVCWRTASRDDAARIFSARFFQVLAELSEATADEVVADEGMARAASSAESQSRGAAASADTGGAASEEHDHEIAPAEEMGDAAAPTACNFRGDAQNAQAEVAGCSARGNVQSDQGSASAQVNVIVGDCADRITSSSVGGAAYNHEAGHASGTNVYAYIRAYDEAVEAVRSETRRSRRLPLRLVPKFDVVDPHTANDACNDGNATEPSTTRPTASAAGIPVLLCNGAAVDGKGYVRLPQSKAERRSDRSHRTDSGADAQRTTLRCLQPVMRGLDGSRSLVSRLLRRGHQPEGFLPFL